MKDYSKLYKSVMTAAIATSAIVAATPAHADSISFKDVDKSSLYYNDIMSLAERGIVQGYAGEFKPTAELRRDHAAIIIAGVLGLDLTNVLDPEFKDVPKSHPQYKEIAALKAAGIISGDGTGKYLPEKTLTRAEMAKILVSAFNLENITGQKAPFSDSKGQWYENYIDILYANGVTKGIGGNKYDPNGIVTREQIASFVVRAEKIGAEVVDAEGAVGVITENSVEIGGNTYILSEDVKAVFNKENQAALSGAKVDIIVRSVSTPVASLNAVAATTNIIVGINGLDLPNKDTNFNGGGYVIPTVTVSADGGVTITNLSAGEFTVQEGASVTLENSLLGTLNVSGTLSLGEGTTVTEIVLTGEAKITVDPSASIEKIILEEGKTLEDVIENYDEIADLLKDVPVDKVKPSGENGEEVKPTPTPTPIYPPVVTSTDAQLAASTANTLVTNLLTKISVNIPSSVGALVPNATNPYTFTFNDKTATLATIKNALDATKLEEALIKSVPADATAIDHILKIKSVEVVNTKNNKSTGTILTPFNNTTSSSTIGDVIDNTITEAELAKYLTNLTGLTHNDAKGLSVESFLNNQGGEFKLTVTFKDNSTLVYNLKLQ